MREGGQELDALRRAVWIDLLSPTPEEEKQVQAALRLEIPTREEMQEIESSSRLYREGDALFLTANFLYGVEGMLRPLAQQAAGPALAGVLVAAYSSQVALLGAGLVLREGDLEAALTLTDRKNPKEIR